MKKFYKKFLKYELEIDRESKTLYIHKPIPVKEFTELKYCIKFWEEDINEIEVVNYERKKNRY